MAEEMSRVDSASRSQTQGSKTTDSKPAADAGDSHDHQREHDFKQSSLAPHAPFADVESHSESVGSVRGAPHSVAQQTPGRFSVKAFYRRHRTLCRAGIHAAVWALFTAWLIHALLWNGGHHRRDGYGWLKPTLVYIALCMRLFFWWLPSSLLMKPAQLVWTHSVVLLYEAIPSGLHQPLAAVGTVAVFLIGSMVPEESGENTRPARAVSLLGLTVMILMLTLTSRNWRKIPWHTVIGGMLTQFVIALFVLRTQVGFDIFNFVSFLARSLLGFAGHGTAFLTEQSVADDVHWFLVAVIPPIIFFIALVQLMYHVGFLQWFVGKFAIFFFWTLRVSGAEAVVAAATPFIGQGESAMLARPFVPHMTDAELHQIMTCGFATIAGSVLVAYISMGLSAQALVSSCIMSIPAALAVSKLRYPETEETLTSGKVVIPVDQEDKAANGLHAFANGAWLGIKVSGMIVATQLCIVAFVAMVDGVLGWWGTYWNIEEPKLGLAMMLGYLLYPVAWLLGLPKSDLLHVGQLIGIKVVQNEFIAFNALTDAAGEYVQMSRRSVLIATYACCGFGNFGSLGTQIGVLSQVAPGRAGDVSRLALSALFSGVLATLTSASVAGMLATDAWAASVVRAG